MATAVLRNNGSAVELTAASCAMGGRFSVQVVTADWARVTRGVVECCGFGGTFAARHPAISGAMVNDKLDSVRESGADVLVSADCGCLLNLHHAADLRRQRGEALPRCVHLASFVRERLGAADAARQVTD